MQYMHTYTFACSFKAIIILALNSPLMLALISHVNVPSKPWREGGASGCRCCECRTASPLRPESSPHRSVPRQRCPPPPESAIASLPCGSTEPRSRARGSGCGRRRLPARQRRWSWRRRCSAAEDCRRSPWTRPADTMDHEWCSYWQAPVRELKDVTCT